MLSRQQQPHPRGDDGERVTRARHAAEVLFAPKRQVVEPSVSASPSSADQPARKPRVLGILSPVPVRLKGIKAPVAPEIADDARNPAIKICAHPRLGKIRHDRFPGRQGLWGCRRRHRAHSQATLTASASWPWTLADIVAGKRKAPRGAWRFRVESIVVGDHSPHGRGIALSGFKSSGRLPSSTFGETSTVHVNWSRTRRTGVRRFRPRRPTPASCRR